MENVIDIRQFRDKQTAKHERELDALGAYGNHAWGRLQKLRGKLSLHDRHFLARQIHQEIERLKQKGVSVPKMGKLAMDAGLTSDLSSKELYRLTLPPNADVETRALRADPSKYVRLIKAIQRHTKESINLLVERLTYGTSFHPRQFKDLEEVERLQATLQEAVNRVDREFSLFEKFQETARLRVDQFRRGGRRLWPFYDDWITESDDQCDIEESAHLSCPYWGKDYKDCYSQRYYAPNLDSDVVALLPHAYLGIVVDWNANATFAGTYTESVDGDMVVIHQNVTEAERAKGINGLRNQLLGYRDDVTEYLDEASGIPVLKFKEDSLGYLYSWIVIYPDAENTGLIPVLCTLFEEGGPCLIPLNVRNLAMLRDWGSVTGPAKSAYERIRELMGYDASNFVIYDEWRRTAPYLEMNPFLREKREKDEKDRNFQARIETFWTKEDSSRENK